LLRCTDENLCTVSNYLTKITSSLKKLAYSIHIPRRYTQFCVLFRSSQKIHGKLRKSAFRDKNRYFLAYTDPTRDVRIFLQTIFDNIIFSDVRGKFHALYYSGPFTICTQTPKFRPSGIYSNIDSVSINEHKLSLK